MVKGWVESVNEWGSKGAIGGERKEKGMFLGHGRKWGDFNRKDFGFVHFKIGGRIEYINSESRCNLVFLFVVFYLLGAYVNILRDINILIY